MLKNVARKICAKEIIITMTIQLPSIPINILMAFFKKIDLLNK